MVSYFGTKVCKLLLLGKRDFTGFENSGVFTRCQVVHFQQP